MLIGLGAALSAALLYGIAAVVQARAVRRLPASQGSGPRLLFGLVRQPLALAVLVLLASGFWLHLVAVRMLPLFLAQAGIAASLVVTALLAVAVHADRLDRTESAAVAGVVGGLILLSAASGSVGADPEGNALVFALLAGVGVNAAVGHRVARSPRPGSAATLGVLAGLGYATVGVCARFLPEVSIGALATSPAPYTMGAAGVVAFYWYSVALRRGAVTLATAPMIVTQTVVPAIVGVVVLGDRVRAGWWPGAIVGFAVTVISAVLLVRFESGGDADTP